MCRFGLLFVISRPDSCLFFCCLFYFLFPHFLNVSSFPSFLPSFLLVFEECMKGLHVHEWLKLQWPIEKLLLTFIWSTLILLQSSAPLISLIVRPATSCPTPAGLVGIVRVFWKPLQQDVESDSSDGLQGAGGNVWSSQPLERRAQVNLIIWRSVCRNEYEIRWEIMQVWNASLHHCARATGGDGD